MCGIRVGHDVPEVLARKRSRTCYEAAIRYDLVSCRAALMINSVPMSRSIGVGTPMCNVFFRSHAAVWLSSIHIDPSSVHNVLWWAGP